MSREVVNQSPTRKTLVTGQSLPAVTTDSRPIPLGRDEDGEPDSQVRAFAVLIRNRADSAVYVREGATDDENRIDPGESFHIWEPNGINQVVVRGTNGGENVEFRTLEAHNDFSITDKIDAFSRALSHFFGTSTRSTEITGDVTVGTINDGVDASIVGSDVTLPVQGTVDIGQFADTVEISDITSATATFDVTGDVGVSGPVTIGSIPDVDIATINDGISVDNGTISVDSLPGITVDTINDGITVDSGSITIDDIIATSATFDGDITGQTDFDLSAATRAGRTVKATAEGNYSVGRFDSQLSTTIREFASYEFVTDALYDGRIRRVTVRHYNSNTVADLGFVVQINDGTGYVEVTPRATESALFAEKYASDSVTRPRFYPGGEAVVVWEPNDPIPFSEGDDVGIEVGPEADSAAGTGDADVEIEIVYDVIQRA